MSKKLRSAVFKLFCLYRQMGVSAPSLHRESTDVLIIIYTNAFFASSIIVVGVTVRLVDTAISSGVYYIISRTSAVI